MSKRDKKKSDKARKANAKKTPDCKWMVSTLKESPMTQPTLQKYAKALDDALGRTEKSATVAVIISADDTDGFYVKTAIGRLPEQNLDVESVRKTVKNAANRVADSMHAELSSVIRKVGQFMAIPLFGDDDGKIGMALEMANSTPIGVLRVPCESGPMDLKGN
jgi:hypothetical protein